MFSAPSNQFIEGRRLRDTWEKVVEHVKAHGKRSDDGRIEIDGLGVLTTDPVGEKHLPEGIADFPEFKEKLFLVEALVNPEIPFYAGQRLMTWSERKTVTQLKSVCDHLRAKPTSNRAVMVTVNAEEDLPMRDDETYDFPPFLVFDFKRRDKLHLITYLRICDVIGWWPINLLQLSRLLDEVSNRVQCQSGEVIMLIGAAYVTENDYAKLWPRIKASGNRPKRT